MKTIFKTYGMLQKKELEDLEQSAKEYLLEMGVDATQGAIDNYIYNSINFDYEDETQLLNKTINNNILCIASIGKWNGRVQGYKICENNLNKILDNISCDEFHVYFDGHNVKAEGHHHDGKNYVEYREIRADRCIDNLLNMIYSGANITRNILNYYTKSLGRYVKEIYGW